MTVCSICWDNIQVGGAVQENIRFEAGSIGPTVGRTNTEAKNRIFSFTARPKECDNIFII